MKLDLSELPIAPIQYKTTGILCLTIGIVIFIIGLTFAVIGQSAREAARDPVKISGEDCEKRIQALGLKPTVAGNKIIITEKDISQTLPLLAQSSQAVSLCPNWTLEQYCLGSGCKTPGLVMTLQYHDPKHP